MPIKISQTKTNIMNFENRIVFAPNGFGKTQFSLFLRDILVGEGKSVGLYTSRELDDLVKIGDKQIFVGEYAPLLKRIETIRSTYIENNPVHKDIRKVFDLSIAEYYSKSYFFRKNDISTRTKIDYFFEAITSLSDKQYSDSIPNDELYNTDLFLDLNLYKRANEVLKNNIDEVLKKSTSQQIPSAIIDELLKIRDYIIIDKQSRCPLCGQEYANNEVLLSKVTETLNGYISTAESDTLKEINEIVLQIYGLLNKRNSNYLKDYFLSKKVRKTDKAGAILNYVICCNEFEILFATHFYNLPIIIDGKEETLGDVAAEFLTKSRSLEIERKTTLKSGNVFVHSVVDEISELLDLSSENITVSETLDSISFKSPDGKRIRKKCIDYFSESQLKRIALILLRAYIRYLDYDCIILDDPIDSYDDYYLDIACSYVSDILEDASDKKWYLFTNNYDLIIKLGELKKNRRFIIFNDNPDLINKVSTITAPPLIIKCNSRDIGVLNINEMILLSKYLDDSTKVNDLKKADFNDGLLPFLSFLVTARNMRDILHKNFNGITIGYAPYVYSDLITKHVENRFMHYNHLESRLTTINDMFNIYVKIVDVDNINVRKLSGDLTASIDAREKIVKTSFSSFKGNKLLNLILYKIIVLSYLKYIIEVKLIDGLIKGGHRVKSVENAHGLGCKIAKAKSIVKGDVGLEMLVNNIEKIHKKYRSLINDYDHALNRMYPPYLSTSIKDMRRLKDDIESI